MTQSFGARRWALALFAGLALLAQLSGCGTTSRDDDPSLGAEKLYAQAKEDLDSGAWDKAIKTLEKVEGRASGTLLAQQAVLDMAYAQWKSAEKMQALSTIDRFIKLYPSSPALDYALYLKGSMNFNDSAGFLSIISRQDLSERDQQASRDAYQTYQQLTEQFPLSKYAIDARQRMDYIVNALAEYEVHVARYYFRRGAFLAAANRAQQVLRDYPRTPSVAEALAIMVAGYDKLGLNDLRDDADRVLRKNFPDSDFARRGPGQSGTSWWRFW